MDIKEFQVFGRIPRKEYAVKISRLFHIPPIGIGTSHVEGLTSYFIRLASAHCLSVGTLFSFELNPIVNRLYIHNKAWHNDQGLLLSRKLPQGVRAVNGIGGTAEGWIDALTNITLCTDLILLTMLSWKKVLPHRWLLRPVHAWCPFCLDELRDSGEQVYEQLIWSLQVVTMCVKHRCHLIEVCCRCNRNTPILSGQSRMGFCISCGQWIGRKYNKHHSDVRHDELLSQTWIHDQLGKLFSDAQRMPSPPEREVVTSFISRCVKVLAGGGFSNLDRALGMSASTVSGWLSGKHSPALGALLKLCFLSKVSLSDVLTGNINFNREPLESQVIVNAIVRHADSSRAKITTKLSDIEKALKNSLNSDSPPPPLLHVASRLKISSAGLRYRFPDLSRLIVEKHRQYKNECNCELRERIVKGLRAALGAPSSEITLQGLARELRCTRKSIETYFPDLSHELMKRSEKARKKKSSEAKRYLISVTNENPPPSFKKVCRGSGRSERFLSANFPELCALITRRHAIYRKEMVSVRHDELIKRVRALAHRLHVCGIYPSMDIIESHMGITVRSHPGVGECLREVRRHLGLKYLRN